MNKGKLYLIPSLISEESKNSTIPSAVHNYIENINIFIVENTRSARRYIKKICPSKNIDKITFFENGKHNKLNLQEDFLKNIITGKNIGLVSEAGLPCIADPGTKIVEYAHQFEIDVIPITGPNSIILALISSGMNGQNFAFNGYLPIEKKIKKITIKQLENKSKKYNQTQIFIETPYRNNQLFQSILETCNANTKLCLAINITAKDELIKTRTIAEWKKINFKIKKQPCVFLIE